MVPLKLEAVAPILMPVHRPVHPLCAKTWSEMIVHAAQHGIASTLVQSTGTPIHWVRNKMAKRALDGKPEPTHLMWLDSDLLVPPDLLTRLWQHDLPVVCGLYYTRGKWKAKNETTGQQGTAYMPTLFYKDDPEADWRDAHRKQAFRGSSLYTDLMVVDGAGMGACLVKAECFKDLPTPWFDFPLTQDGLEPQCGEDLFFFQRLQQAGYETVVDTTIEGIFHHADGWVGQPGHLYDTSDLLGG